MREALANLDQNILPGSTPLVDGKRSPAPSVQNGNYEIILLGEA